MDPLLLETSYSNHLNLWDAYVYAWMPDDQLEALQFSTIMPWLNPNLVPHHKLNLGYTALLANMVCDMPDDEEDDNPFSHRICIGNGCSFAAPLNPASRVDRLLSHQLSVWHSVESQASSSR